jgi:hypothetical protein
MPGVTQFTVAAATRPSLASLVKTYSPYGIMRSAVFLASASILFLLESPGIARAAAMCARAWN